MMIGRRPFITQQMLLVIYSVFFEYFLFTTFVVYSGQIALDLLPHSDPNTRHLFGICIFLVASIARPIGGILFSNIGDSSHRSKIFYITTLAMAITSIFISILPVFHLMGCLGAMILLIVRFIQGIAIGAEIPEGIVYCYEKSEHGFRVMATNLTTVAIAAGYLVAVVMTLSKIDYFNYHSWRVSLFICGVISLALTPLLRGAFGSVIYRVAVERYNPLKDIFALHKLDLLRLICFSTFLTSATVVFLYVMPDYLKDYFHYTEYQTRSSSLFVAGSFLSGSLLAVFLHDKMGKAFFLTAGMFMKGLLILVFHSYIHHGLIEITILNSICMFIFGFFMAKLPALMASHFPHHMRYTGVSIVYNVSFGVMYAVSQLLINWLITETKSLYMPSMYIMFFSYVSLVSLWFMSNESFFNYKD